MEKYSIIYHGGDAETLRKLREFITNIPFGLPGDDAIRVIERRRVNSGRWGSYQDTLGDYPDYAFLDAVNDWGSVSSFFGLDDQAEEAPAPPLSGLSEEEEKQACLKFNLSPEQWEPLPPDAKRALADKEVTIVKQAEMEWRPCSEPPNSSYTIMMTNDVRAALDSCGAVRSGYYSDGDWHAPGTGTFTPTHWCHIPGGALREQQERGEEEEVFEE